MGTLHPDPAGPRSELARLRAVVETQQAIIEHAHDPAAVMAVVVERARALTDATGAVVELVEGDEMVYRSVTGTVAGSLGVRLASAASLSGRCVATHRPLRCDDTELDPRVDREACRHVGARSMVVVPLFLADARCVGVLKVVSDEPNAFDRSDEVLLEELAGFVARSLQQAQAFEDLGRRATHDPLTGLPNRSLLLDRLAVSLARSCRSGGGVAVLFIDLDGFKAVNDTHGHDAGDRVLVAVAGRLRATVRDADTVARLGGDEFVVACEGVSSAELADLEARIRAAVDDEIHVGTNDVVVGASVGVAVAFDGDSAEALLARADAHMYDRKRAART